MDRRLAKTLFLLGSALVLGLGCTAREAPPEKPALDIAALRSVELKVEGMVCEACEQTIGEKIGGLAGVESCVASHTEKSAVVRYDPGQTSPQALAAAITALGYRASAP